MKKQISFSQEPEAYRFTLENSDNAVFEISKSTLKFCSNDFYTLFFEGLDEKPEYALAKPDKELKGQAKHVYDTVAAILKKTCETIDAGWFKDSDDQGGANHDSADKAISSDEEE